MGRPHWALCAFGAQQLWAGAQAARFLVPAGTDPRAIPYRIAPFIVKMCTGFTGMDLTCDETGSDSPYVETIWHSRSVRAEPFISMADSHCGLVITSYRGKTTITVRGPETKATPAAGHDGADFLGIRFRPGVFMPQFPAGKIIDRHDVELPDASRRSFWLAGSAWEYPVLENIESFIGRLRREGLLVFDPLVAETLQGRPVDMAERTVQRHFLNATGLTYGSMFQIDRARHALSLLKQGATILEAVEQAGYFDQPHLTRAFKRYIGLTPAEVIRSERNESLSFLYKTSPSASTTLWAQGEARVRAGASGSRQARNTF